MIATLSLRESGYHRHAREKVTQLCGWGDRGGVKGDDMTRV